MIVRLVVVLVFSSFPCFLISSCLFFLVPRRLLRLLVVRLGMLVVGAVFGGLGRFVWSDAAFGAFWVRLGALLAALGRSWAALGRGTLSRSWEMISEHFLHET